MTDLRNYTVREFAEMVNENYDVIADMVRENAHIGYTTNPYENLVAVVANSEIKETNKEITVKFLYTCICNRPEHRFYDTKGYTVGLRG